MIPMQPTSCQARGVWKLFSDITSFFYQEYFIITDIESDTLSI